MSCVRPSPGRVLVFPTLIRCIAQPNQWESLLVVARRRVRVSRVRVRVRVSFRHAIFGGAPYHGMKYKYASGESGLGEWERAYV